MKPSKILIVDDEKPARSKTRKMLNALHAECEIIEAENGLEAVKQIKKAEPELVLLDIQMPGLDGFEVIDEIGVENMPVVIFITAYDQYAINAFEVNAVDYLLKPFDKDRFAKSFNRAVKRLNSGEEDQTRLSLLIQEIKSKSSYLERFLVNKGQRYYFVNTKDIIYISSDEKYIVLHTAKGKHLVRETLSNTEEQLNPQLFSRVHRSYIVNAEHIQEIQPWSHGDYVIILDNGERISMSRRYKDSLMK